MRIVTRPDFDGVVCAVLLRHIYSVVTPILWTEPGLIQHNAVTITDEDIIANLPWHPSCKLWFDHHVSNKHNSDFNGTFQIAPSAAGIIYNYYKNSFLDNIFHKLIYETDRIDSANLTRDEILNPEINPWLLISFTISSDKGEKLYWDKLVDLIGQKNVKDILQDKEVLHKADTFCSNNTWYKDLLLKTTEMKGCLSITDYRKYRNVPGNNRFLVYTLFPECSVNMKIFYDPTDTTTVIIKVGHSIFNRACNVNVGNLMKKYGGGGHNGAGTCRFSKEFEEEYINEISQVLMKNK